MHIVYLILGSNLGDSKKFLEEACTLITQRIGTLLVSSAIYETTPWGVQDQPNYLNQVLKVMTTLSPENTLTEAQAIESILGRKRNMKWEARVIDIDLLFYDEVIFDTTNLKVPHPLLHLRKFVLTPLVEIAPNLVHPVLKMTVGELLKKLKDDLNVRQVSHNSTIDSKDKRQKF